MNTQTIFGAAALTVAIAGCGSGAGPSFATATNGVLM